MTDDQILAAGDHGIIPAVVFLIEIPKEICDSWHTGEIFVVLKDSAYEPSLPLCHACEL